MCPTALTSGWLLTVPQVGISEIEGPDKAGEGVLCGAGLNLPLHGRQLHVLQARPLSLDIHSLGLRLQPCSASRGLGLVCSLPNSSLLTIYLI